VENTPTCRSSTCPAAAADLPARSPQIAQSITTPYKTQLPIVARPVRAVPVGVADFGAQSNGLSQAVNSAVADLVTGKQSLSSWSGTAAS